MITRPVLQEVVGDLFDFTASHAICVPTNVGWRRDGSNAMGAGIAKRAAQTWPMLPRMLGEYCSRYKEQSGVVGWWVFAPEAFLICVPVKPLTSRHNMSWDQHASLPLIEKSIQELVKLVDSNADAGDSRLQNICLPRLGCGNGSLNWRDVKPILERYLDERFTIVSTLEDTRREP